MKTLYYKKTALLALTSIIIVSFLTHPAIAQIVNCIDFKPNTLNINSCGKWATVYIELDGYNPEEINIETILLNGQVAPVLDPSCYLVDETCEAGVVERMIKFKREEVEAILPLGDEIEINISGQLNDGTPFEGIDVIQVIDGESNARKGDINCDGTINISDFQLIINLYLTITPAPTEWESWAADCDNNGSINVGDIQLIIFKILFEIY